MKLNSSAPAETPPTRYQPGAAALQDAWFPLIHAARVRERPVRLAVHGQPVFVSRGSGGIRAACFRGERSDTVPGATAFTRADGTYPLTERFGFVWVWYGNPANASPDLLPLIPHVPTEGMSRRFQFTMLWDCAYELQCENVVDLTHADFLHAGFTGPALSDDDEVNVESTSETVTMTRIAHGRSVPFLQRALGAGRAKKQDLYMVTHLHVRTGLSIVYVDLESGMKIWVTLAANPESPTRTRAPGIADTRSSFLGRNLIVPGIHIIGRQDNWVMRAQNPSYLSGHVDRDLSSRFDKAGLRYRKVYQALVARQSEGDCSYLSDGDPALDVWRDLPVGPRS